MLKKKWFWTLLAILLVAAAGGGYYYFTQIAPTNTASVTQEAASMQTAVASRGDLVVMASGTGKVVAASQVSLGFDEAGVLLEWKVQVGDQVKAGDVLARLQTNNTQEEIDAAISDAELEVIRKRQAIDALYANAEIARTQALNDMATYAQAVRDAQYQMENYIMPPVLQGMDAVQAVDEMKARLDSAWKNFEPYKYYRADDSRRQALLEALNLAQSNYDAAVKRLNYEYALQVAEANLQKARQDYEKYKDGPAEADLALAQAELANAEAKLKLAQEAQSVKELIAPMDATVMSINANVGESVSSGTIITLADMNHPRLEVYLDETDLDKVAVGYEAEVVFDALPDQTFKGRVVVVSPQLEEVSNVQAVKLYVELDTTGTTINLPAGLNAAVDVIAGRATNAVLVPVEALRELDPGEYGVFVIENGEPILRVVQVGLQDVTMAEIISGVEAGETVSTGVVAVSK